jgi:hypothetical protein
MILNAIVIKSDSSGNLTLLDTNPIFRNSSNKNVIYFYSPFSVANSIKIGFTLNNGVDTTTYPAFSSTATVDSLILPADQEPDYNIREFTMPIAITNQVAQKGATDTIMGFVESELQSSDDYLEPIVISDGVDVDGDLDTAFPSPAIGNFANVWNSSNNTFYSYLAMSVTPTVWDNQSKLLNQIFTGTTGTIVLAINKAIATNDTDVDVTVTQLMLEELAEQRQIIETLTSGGMSKSVYDTDDNGIVDKAETLDDDVGNTMTALEGKTLVSRVDQDLKISAEVVHAKVTTPILDLGTVEITEETNEIIQAEFDSGNIIRLGEELDYQFKNDSGSIIAKGTPVYISGADGTNVLIKPSINTNHDIAIRTVGITKADVAINGFVKVILFGNLRNVATDGSLASPIETWVAGDEIYLNGVLGSLTNVRPTGSDTIIFIGVVQRAHATLGELTLQLRHLPRITELSAIHPDWADLIDGDFLTYDVVNNYMIVKNLNDYAFVKTGWDLDIQALVSLSFVNATRTFTLAKTSAVVPYWQENIKYELDADKTVVIDDIEGLWFIYIVDGVLTASQTVWDLRADNAIPVSVVNWDATNNEAMAVAYECHSHLMSGVDHYDSHFGLGTLHIRGGALSDNGSDQLDLTALTIADEDINISVVDDDTPTAYFEQPLTPLKSYKYYRSGANGDLRRVDDSTTPFYMLSNKVQLNPFSGGTWGLTPMTNNKYGAYWNIWTTDISNPVKQFLGQEEADSLDDAIASNTLSSLDLGTIPFEEIKVAYRIIVKQIVGAPYYEITQIDNMLVDPITGVPTLTPSSHGALSGLGDDDHTQYYNATRIAAWKVSDVDPDIALRVEKDLSNNTTYPIATASGLVDDSLTDVFIDDNGTPKKITLNEIYVGANAATGAFVASGDYQADGLGAYETAVIDYHTLTLDTLGKYKVTIKTMETSKILYVKMPTISSNQNDLQISTDDGTTYYDVLVNGGNIYAELVSEKLLKLQFDGSNFIIDLQALSQQLTFDSSINSTYGTVAPINGSPQLNKFYGLSLKQEFIFEDVGADGLADGFALFRFDTESFTSGVQSLDATTDASTSYFYKDGQTFISGNTYYISIVIGVPRSQDVGIIAFDNGAYTGGVTIVSDTTLPIGKTRISGVFTSARTTNRLAFKVSSPLVDETFTFEEVQTIDITNTPLSTHTAPQINAIIPTYFEGYTYIVNPELWSRGLNLFDELNDIAYEDFNLNSSGANQSAVGDFISPYYDVSNMTTITISDLNGISLRLSEYSDEDVSTHILRTTGTTSVSVTLNTNTKYVRFSGQFVNVDTIQLNEGLSVLTYQAYNSPQDNFKLHTNLLSVGSIRDEAYELNGVWWKKAYVGVIEDVAISDVIDTTAIPLILETTGVFYAVDSVNNEAQYGTYGDTLTLTGTSTVYYQLATQTLTVIEKDGSLIQESNTTIVQLNNFATSYTLTFALDSTAQLSTLVDRSIYQQGEIEGLEGDVETLDTEQIAQGVRITTLENRTNILFDGSFTIPTDADTQPGSANVTLTGSVNDYDELKIFWGSIATDSSYIESVKFGETGSDTKQLMSGNTNSHNDKLHIQTFKLTLGTTFTKLTAWGARGTGLTASTDTITNNPAPSLLLTKIIGINY